MKKILLVATTLFCGGIFTTLLLFQNKPQIASPLLENYANKKTNHDTENEALEQEIIKIINQAQGGFGVVVAYLETGERVEVNSETPIYAASLTKVPPLITLYRLYEEGKLTPETKVTYLEEDSEWGDGTIQNDPVGTTYTLEQVAWHLGHESDNVAKNILYRTLPWLEIEKTFESIGIRAKTNENIYTTNEMAKVWEYLYGASCTTRRVDSNCQPDGLTARGATEIFELLTDTTTEERIPAAVPQGVAVSHKIGTWSDTGSWHDCGIVFLENPVLICVMGEDSTYEESVRVIREITKVAVSPTGI